MSTVRVGRAANDLRAFIVVPVVTGALLGVGTIGLWIPVSTRRSDGLVRDKCSKEPLPHDGTVRLAVERLTLDDLLSEARQHGIADLRRRLCRART